MDLKAIIVFKMAVVRVKRRCDEEPLDIVLLACKKRRTEDIPETSVFQFAATVNDQSQSMSSKKCNQNLAAFHRMNYIYQLMNLSSAYRGNEGYLTSNYGKMLLSIGKKSLSRMEPEIKRTICKHCHILLVPGETATVRLHKKPAARVVWKCMQCYSVRRFNVRPGYEIWVEKEEAVVETIKHSENTDDTQNIDCNSEGTKQ